MKLSVECNEEEEEEGKEGKMLQRRVEISALREERSKVVAVAERIEDQPAVGSR